MRQSQLLNQTRTARSDDAGEKFLLDGGFIRKLHSGVYVYPPAGALVRTRLIELYGSAAEGAGAQHVQLSNLAPELRSGQMGGYSFRLVSSYSGERALATRSEESIGHMLRSSWPRGSWYTGAFVWAVSREYRPSGGGRGYRRSIEYENLVTYAVRKAAARELADNFKQLAQPLLAALALEASWEPARPNETGEYIAHDLVTRLGPEESFRIGQICEFSSDSARALGLEPPNSDGSTRAVCFSLSINRTLYATARQLIRNPASMWPVSLAPFVCHIVPATSQLSDEHGAAFSAYRNLLDHGLSCLIDDRPLAPGRKFADSDLLRLPIRLVFPAKALECGSIGVRLFGDPEVRMSIDAAIESATGANRNG
jgi:prolyl-tRNA synthetase